MPFSLFRLRFANREHRMKNNIFKACTLINERRAQHYRPAEALPSPTTHTHTHTHTQLHSHTDTRKQPRISALCAWK